MSRPVSLAVSRIFRNLMRERSAPPNRLQHVAQRLPIESLASIVEAAETQAARWMLCDMCIFMFRIERTGLEDVQRRPCLPGFFMRDQESVDLHPRPDVEGGA